MKWNDIPNIKNVAICAIVLIVLALCAYFYWDTRSNIARSMEYALEEAIEKDFQEREFAELRYSGGKLGRKIKGVTIVTEEGEEDFEFKDSIDEAVGHRLATQYLLAKIRPLHPDTLNSLLQETLRKFDYEIPTGVLYTHKGQVQYSGNDSVAFHRPFLHWTRNRSLDVKRTLFVQAWASIAPWHICLNIPAGAFWSLLLFGSLPRGLSLHGIPVPKIRIRLSWAKCFSIRRTGSWLSMVRNVPYGIKNTVCC